jgi:DNA-binding protein HU-beta
VAKKRKGLFMNKVQMADKISERVGITKAQAEEALNTFTAVTIDTLKAGGEVTLTGFGAFSARRRKGREGINPRNPSQKITIPSVVVAKFKTGKTLKEELKKSGMEPQSEPEVAETSEAESTETTE